MSRLKPAFHMRFADVIAFRDAIKNTPFKDLQEWEWVCQGNRISTEGVLYWLWLTWSYQLAEIGRKNYSFIEWRFRNLKLPWPYGTLKIPVAILGKAELGRSLPNIHYENATT